MLLPKEQRKRIQFVDYMEEADYFVGFYRWHNLDYDFKHEVYSAKIGNTKIASAYKLNPVDPSQKKLLKQFFTDFENPDNNWTSLRIHVPVSGAHSGKNVTYVDSTEQYSDMLCLTNNVNDLVNNDSLFVNVSFWKYEKDLNANALLVISIESDGKVDYWRRVYEIKNSADNEIGKWVYVSNVIRVPRLQSKKIKIMLWNRNDKTIFMDDVKVSFYGV
jgi:hypothetical protein